jgi:hypothetical protein
LGEPLSQKEYRKNELSAFRCLFSEEVSKTIRQSAKLFKDGIYCNLSAQQGAFNRLEEVLKASKFEIVSVTRSSFEKDEAMFQVMVRIPVMQTFYKELFKQELAEGTKGYVMVSFYMGVCKEFVRLEKKNEMLDLLDKAIRKARHGDEPTPVTDPAFDPLLVIPSLLKNMRLDRRYRYMLFGDQGTVSPKRYYQSPEGFIYQIEIDGYSAMAS